MDEATQTALNADKVIDITTTGRKSNDPRRIEIWFYQIDQRTFITGSPGRRDWYANLVAYPTFTFHLKESHQADLPATARAITDDDERREVFTSVIAIWDGGHDLDAWMASAPLVEVTFDT